MTDPASFTPLQDLSGALVGLVAGAAPAVVSVHSHQSHSSGFVWRPGLIVTADEALADEGDVAVGLPDGGTLPARVAGRDPTTDVAVLRFKPDGLPVAATTNAAVRAGETVLAVGNYDGSPLAALGIVALAGGPWHSTRGGTIDNFIRLDLALSALGEGGALVNAHGQVVAMTVLGPRHRAIAIPASTIERSVDQLLARGQVFRGYLGAGLRPIGRERASRGAAGSEEGHGVLVVSIDPEGPSRRAGLLLGDIVTAWNGKPIERVREVMHLLGPESVGTTVDLSLTRGGAPAALKIVIGERPVT